MPSYLQSPLALLPFLAVLGVGLAVLGTAVGATTPHAASGPGTAFVVSEDNVTVEQGDQQVTVVDNMTRVDSIEIERQGSGTYQVNTETEDPLTDSERSHAEAIARDNATVQQVLRDVEQYELTVEPIHKLTADSVRTTTVTGFNSTSMESETAEGEETFTLTVEDGDETGTVTIDRHPEYVKDEAAIRIRNPSTDEVYYSATVDLENETVTEITDWRSD